MSPTTEAQREPEATQGEIREVLAIAEHGFLGITTPEGWPGVVPLNFVVLGETLYFHGSHEGEKMRSLAREPRVAFTVVDPGALIPSYLRHPRSACPATQYYRSVMLHGRARVVGDAAEKARALQALMEKLQPEGGYEPMVAEGGEAAACYAKALSGTAVVAIEIERATFKCKFGQNLSAAKWRAVRAGLLERGTELDRRTVELMERYDAR